uniref:Uncharacterized protein n=1 Tax=Cannabis sativa TaxID=3483 RepID=A0A803PJL5_CANSA
MMKRLQRQGKTGRALTKARTTSSKGYNRELVSPHGMKAIGAFEPEQPYDPRGKDMSRGQGAKTVVHGRPLTAIRCQSEKARPRGGDLKNHPSNKMRGHDLPESDTKGWKNNAALTKLSIVGRIAQKRAKILRSSRKAQGIINIEDAYIQALGFLSTNSFHNRYQLHADFCSNFANT